MSTKAISTQGSYQWQNAFVPGTSSWEGKPACKSEFDSNQNCCVSGYDIEAVLEQAYEDGFESHPGVKALENRPCTSAMDLETLADELATLEPKTKEQTELDQPKNFNPISNPVEIEDSSILDYCADFVHRVLKKSYGGSAEVPEKRVLGEKFKEAFEFCGEAISMRVSIFDILQNSFMHKKRQIRVETAPPSTFGLQNQEGPRDW